MKPGGLFVGALAVFALIGLLAGRGPTPSEVDRPVAPSPPVAAAQAEATPRAIARRWGQAFAAWTHTSLASQLRRLADTATPELAAELRRGAQAIGRDASLTRDGAGSRGSVQFVRLNGHSSRRRVLVLTREIAYLRSGQDVLGARYRVYKGNLVRDPSGGWRVESWERQP